jgi:hypothetical protein
MMEQCCNEGSLLTITSVHTVLTIGSCSLGLPLLYESKQGSQASADKTNITLQ